MFGARFGVTLKITLQAEIEVGIYCLVFSPVLTYLLSVNLLVLIRVIHLHPGQNNPTHTDS